MCPLICSRSLAYSIKHSRKESSLLLLYLASISCRSRGVASCFPFPVLSTLASACTPSPSEWPSLTDLLYPLHAPGSCLVMQPRVYCCWCDFIAYHVVCSLQSLRSKTKTLFSYPSYPEQLPIWNFDGSSTGQAVGHDSDVYMKPVAIYKNPMLPGDNCLVLCETQTEDGKPHPSNNRHSCAKVSWLSPNTVLCIVRITINSSTLLSMV